MEYKKLASNKKPIINDESKQLFSFDVCKTGAKNFIFMSYENIYKIIKEKQSNIYEDNTYAKGIKLHIDFDDKRICETHLEQDKYIETIINKILNQINIKILNTFNIENPRIIILKSDTLLKISLHFIFPDMIFNTMSEMKYFMADIENIDQSIYRIGCFRMMYCSKFGKNNKLIYYDSRNYENLNDDYKLFLDTCICYIENKVKLKLDIQTDIRKKYIRTIKINNNEIIRNYKYNNIDFDKIENALTILEKMSSNYQDWLMIAFCLKDLYLCSDEKKKIYKLFNNFSNKSDKYNKNENKKIFMNIDPIVDINYLFNMANIKYYMQPFYNYKEIIFNSQNHKNIIIKNEKYIDVNIIELLKYKYIFLNRQLDLGKQQY